MEKFAKRNAIQKFTKVFSLYWTNSKTRDLFHCITLFKFVGNYLKQTKQQRQNPKDETRGEFDYELGRVYISIIVTTNTTTTDIRHRDSISVELSSDFQKFTQLLVEIKNVNTFHRSLTGPYSLRRREEE